jgi:hypothetical protein
MFADLSFVLRLMVIHFDDTKYADDLCAHYMRSGFTCERVGGSAVEVSRPDAPTTDQAERECLMHLRVWKVSNPDAVVDFA